MGHLVRWFTILKTGDCPVRKRLVYPRVKHDEANNHIRNIFLGRHHNTIFWNPKATVSFWASPTMGCCQISSVCHDFPVKHSHTIKWLGKCGKFFAPWLPPNGKYTILWIPVAQRSLHSPPDSMNGKITNRTSLVTKGPKYIHRSLSVTMNIPLICQYRYILKCDFFKKNYLVSGFPS